MTNVPAALTAEEGSRRRTALLLGGVGCLHALLFLLAYGLLTSTPGAHAPDEEILAFYRSGSQRRLVLVGLYVMPFAGIAFLWFSTILRVWTRASAPRDEVVSGVQLVSGILYVGLFFAAAAASSVMAVSIEFSRSPVDPVVARQFPQYGGTLLLAFAMRMAAMFVFTTSRLGRTAGVLPRWFAHLGVVVGLFLLLSASFSRALVLVFPLWLLALCALILARSGRRSPWAPA
jgi:hypothetical protein